MQQGASLALRRVNCAVRAIPGQTAGHGVALLIGHVTRSVVLLPTATGNPQVRVRSIDVLSDNWYVLRKVTFDFQRKDGRWQTLSRRPTIAAMAPPFCCTAAPGKR